MEDGIEQTKSFLLDSYTYTYVSPEKVILDISNNTTTLPEKTNITQFTSLTN